MGILESLLERTVTDVTPIIREEVASGMNPLLERLDEIVRLLTLIERDGRPR